MNLKINEFNESINVDDYELSQYIKCMFIIF